MKKILLVVFVCFLSFALAAQNSPFLHIEPPFWWAGMHYTSLQVMLHGEDISVMAVESQHPEVQIDQVIRVANPNYLFINLQIGEAAPGIVPLVFRNPLNGEIITINYELKTRRSRSAARKGFSPADVLYLLMPDRFANGDPDNDSPSQMKEKANRADANGRHGGDFKGIIEHLEYIESMGFTALWLNPFQENNNPDYSYHGYAITDYYKADPRFGTNDDYVDLVAQCHTRQMKVIMDYILNHASLYHWFIEDLPSENWIHKHPEYTPSNFRGSVIADPHASVYDQNVMLTGWFDHHMPDLDQRNPLVRNYLIQNTIWWIEYADLDGIRLDTQPYSYKEMVTEWAQRIFSEYPDFMIVGEAWLQKEGITAFYQEFSDGLGFGYNSHIPSVTDFPLYGAITQGLHEDEGWNTGLFRIYYTLAQDFLYPQPENNLIFLDNHDLERFSYLSGGSLASYKMAIALLLTTRGIPQIYYGTELLMHGEKNKGHGFIREDFPGGWKEDSRNAFSGVGLTDDQVDAQRYMKNILQWRKSSDAVHRGKLIHFLPENEVYVYFRISGDQRVMVVVNKGNNVVPFDGSRYAECLSGAVDGINIIDNSYIVFDRFRIKPQTAYIITYESN
ncbi:MAG: alpha-amlyase [Bacteroidia bacterium]|nr:alpha-amlyase [Bacteroidia bacterium]